MKILLSLVICLSIPTTLLANEEWEDACQELARIFGYHVPPVPRAETNNTPENRGKEIRKRKFSQIATSPLGIYSSNIMQD